MDGNVKVDAKKRLLIIKGHLEHVIKMVDGDFYCPDVIHQSQAIQAALKKVDEVVLHGHLHSCVLKDVHGTGAKKEKLVEEIVTLFRKNE